MQPTEKNPNRILLDKHLNDYTAKNTFDYFIHKDLGGFLRRELDFYIKNETMFLDDLDTENEVRLEQYIRGRQSSPDCPPPVNYRDALTRREDGKNSGPAD